MDIITKYETILDRLWNDRKNQKNNIEAVLNRLEALGEPSILSIFEV